MARKKRKREVAALRAIFFDLGGVVVTKAYDPLNAFAKRAGVSRRSFFRSARRDIELFIRGRKNSRKFTDRLCKRFGLPVFSAKSLRRFWYELYRKNTRVRQPVLELAQALRKKYTVGMISDTIAEHTRINVRRGIFAFFKPVILSYRVHANKPHANIFRLALRQARVEAAESLFIDDLSQNIRGARKIGMRAILFKSVRQLRRSLKKIGIGRI